MSSETFCTVHKREIIVATCPSCGRGMCYRCMRGGKLCEACRLAPPKKVPKGGTADDVIERRAELARKIIVRGVLPGVAAIILAVILYYVLDASGTIRWRMKSSASQNLALLGLVDDTLVVRQGPKLLGLAASGGARKWEAPCGPGRGMLAGKVVIVRGEEGALQGLDALTGQPKWTCPFPRQIGFLPEKAGEVLVLAQMSSRPRPASGPAGLSASRPKPASRPARTADEEEEDGDDEGFHDLHYTLVAVETASGRVLWSKDCPEKLSLMEPVVGPDTVYVPTAAWEGLRKVRRSVLAYDLRTGGGKWQAEVSGDDPPDVFPCAQGVLLLTSATAHFLAGDGREAWKVARSVGELTLPDPLFCDQTVILPITGKTLARIRLSDGATLWQADVPYLPVALAADAEQVYVSGTAATAIELPGQLGQAISSVGGNQETKTYLSALAMSDGKVAWGRDKAGTQLLISHGLVINVAVGSSLHLLSQAVSNFSDVDALTPSGKKLWSCRLDGQVDGLAADARRVYFCMQDTRTAIGVGTTPTDLGDLVGAISIGW